MVESRNTLQDTAPRREVVPSGLWPGSSPELIAAHERTLALVAAVPPEAGGAGARVVARNVGLFLLILLLTVSAIGESLRHFPGIRLDEGVARDKYAYFAQAKDDFDVVFVGSSQVYRHVDAPLFDRRLAQAGHPVKSFNFGLPGMYFPEVVHTVDWILEQRPKKLKWLFVELRELEPHAVAANRLSRREINWHTPRAMTLVLKWTWGSDDSLSAKLAASKDTLTRGLFRWGNVSLAYPLAEALLGRAPRAPADWPRQGFLAMDVEAAENPGDALVRRRHEAFLEYPRIYAERLEDWYADRPDRQPSELQLEVFSGLVQAAEAAGAQPVFFLGVPGWRKYADIVRSREMGVIPCLFAYNDPGVFPEFYERERLYDFRHLYSDGAARFTTLLADDFTRYLETPANVAPGIP